MKIFTLSFKSLLLAAGLMLGSANAWAAGYTRTLTDKLEVTGYKAKAFYDFQNNTPAVLPTSGDLRYRSDGVWGLHNFGSGTRTGTATISVASTDILVIQNYTGYTSTINRGTENATLSASTGYQVFNISTTADDITFSVPRYGGIVAAFVMEVDESAETADYTINYKASGETVKTVSGNEAVGTVIPVLSSFTEGGKKYNTDGGQATSLTVAKGGSTLNINVTEAAKYTCTINAKAGDVLLATEEESVYAGEDVTVYYQMGYAKDGKWYFIDKNGSTPGYGVAFNSVTSNQTANKTTYTLNEDVVYFAETEDLTLVGSWAANGAYLNWRSNGMAKRMGSNSYIYTSTIDPGVYDITLWARNQRSAGAGTETLPIFLRDGEGNLTDLDVSFPGWERGGYEAAKTATITIPDDGKDYSVVINNNSGYTSNLEMDYLYITTKKNVAVTVTSAGWATLYTPCALDFSEIDGLTAYTATEADGVVTLTAVDDVPANTGVVLKGTADTYKIPVIASSETDKGGLQGSATVSTNADAAPDGKAYYILTKSGEEAEFQAASGTIAAGKAYLVADWASGGTAKSLRVVVDGETTEVTAPEVAETEEEEVLFNMAGIQVDKNFKGFVINQKGVKRFNK